MPAITEEKQQEKQPTAGKKPGTIAETNGELKEADKTSCSNGGTPKQSSSDEKQSLQRANSTPEQELNGSISDSTASSSPGGETTTEEEPLVAEEEQSKDDAAAAAAASGVEKVNRAAEQQEVDGVEGETSLKLNLVLPGVAQVQEIVMSPREMVHDLLQFSVEAPECRHRTCLSIRLNGKKIDNFVELGSVEGLKSGCTIELVEEPYTVSDVMFHLHRFKELMGMDHSHVSQAVSCCDGHSLSFLSMITQGDPEGTNWREETSSVAVPPSHCLPPEAQGLDSSQPFSPPLSPFYPANVETHFQVPDCIKSLSFSPWNPPPSHRKLKGDLLYLDVVTLEGEEFCITAQSTGFFLNKMSGTSVFDPTARKMAHHSKYLTGLLSQVSPLYRKNYNQLHKLWEKRHSIEILPIPYPVFPWAAPKCDPKPVSFRIGESASPLFTRTTSDELLVGQVGCQRDWNEEFQSTKELPATSFIQKLFKDRTQFKIHTDFLQTAIKGSIAAVDGHLHPLNAADPKKHHLYLWNNIFFSTTSDGRGNFDELGGDEAVHVATRLDLRGIGVLNDLGIQELSTLGAIVVDYRGHRVFAQSIVPGMLQRMEQENAIMYGTLDNRKKFVTNDSFEKKLKLYAEKLHLKTHKVMTASEEPKELTLPLSVETKGIRGTDGRLYVLDLFRIFPPDANFADPALLQPGEGVEEKSCSELGLRHKLSVLRPELVTKFISHQWWLFLAIARGVCAQKEKQEATKENKDDKKEEKVEEQNESSPLVNKETESTDSEGVLDQALAGSSPLARLPIGIVTPGAMPLAAASPMKDHSADDLLTKKEVCDSELDSLSSPEGADSSLSLPEELETDKELTDSESGDKERPEIADWLKVVCSSESLPAVTEALDTIAHQLGSDSAMNFNIEFNTDIFAPNLDRADPPEQIKRDVSLATGAADYLLKTCISRLIRDCVQLTAAPLDGGALCRLLHERGINMRYLGKIATYAATREDLSHLTRLCISEMIIRVAKRQFRKLMTEVPLHQTSAAVACFLNCLLSTEDASEESGASQQKKRSRKKKATKGKPPQQEENVYQKLTQQRLWSDMKTDISLHYRYQLDSASLSEACTTHGLHKLALLREFCLKTGVQILLRDYVFNGPGTFTAEDIVALVPVVQHSNFKPAELVQLYQVAMQQLSTLNLSKALEMFMEALQLFNQVYGPMHLDIANCYLQIAKIHYSLGDSLSALTYHHKATMMHERLLGVDHIETISCYFSLALYCQAANSTLTGLKLLYRVRYLILLVSGSDHPELANCDYHIGLMLYDVKEYGLSVQFLIKAVELQYKYFGKETIRVAVSHHLIARSLSCLGDLRQALVHEKITFSIYKSKLGEDHQYTKESSECLQQLTEKAVMVQKKINQMTGGKGSALTTPTGMSEPFLGSWSEVMGMLSSRTDHHNSRQTTSRGKVVHRRRSKHL